MHDKKGFHKVGNPGEELAVTLHVYSPPFDRCSIFNANNEKVEIPCEFDTEVGILQNLT